MGKLVDDLKHLTTDIRHIHDDVEHLSGDLDHLAEKAGLDEAALPALTDLRDHLKDLDAHMHDVLRHVEHVEIEIAPKM